jgi:hypothetical protein
VGDYVVKLVRHSARSKDINTGGVSKNFLYASPSKATMTISLGIFWDKCGGKFKTITPAI